MAGLVPAIHVLLAGAQLSEKDVDARDKRGHDEEELSELASPCQAIYSAKYIAS
jgi:hypothetical protein